MITVTTSKEAWDVARQLTGWVLEPAVKASERAGYTIMRDATEPENYICDLGNRLAINKKDRIAVQNIWIEPIKDEPDMKTYIFQLIFKKGEKLTFVTKAVQKCNDWDVDYLLLMAQSAARAVKEDNKGIDIGELADYRYIGTLDELRTY